MSKWEKVKLGDICTVVSGTTPKSNIPEYWNGNYNWVTPAEITDNTVFVNETQRKITDAAIVSTSLKAFPSGTVLLSSRAPIGKVAIAGTEMYCNQGFKNLICSEKIYNKYLFWFLKSKSNYLNSLGRGATFKEISKPLVEKVEVPLPPLEEQHKIASILDTVSEALKLRKQQLNELDLLIKSKFEEMFGDPNSNPMGWTKEPMGNYTTVLTDFSSNGCYEYLDSNVTMYDEPNYALMVRTTDLEQNDFENDVKYIDEQAYKVLAKSKVYGGEIIMNKIGSAGKIYLMPYLNRPVSLGRNSFLFRYNENIDVVFLYYQLTTDYGTNEIMQHVRGAVTKTITKNDARSVKIIVPPIELQNKFASFVEHVDELKSEVQKSIDQLQTLFDSLMQEYFE